MHARITAHLDTLYFELLTVESIPGELEILEMSPLDGRAQYRIAIQNTSQHLGVSDEALALLRRVRICGPRETAHLNWTEKSSGTEFYWIGEANNFALPTQCRAGGGFGVRDYVRVPNDMRADVMAAIEAHAERRQEQERIRAQIGLRPVSAKKLANPRA